MKLIVGLGNPGRVYIDSRHNIGFAVIKALSQFFKAHFIREGDSLSLTARGKIKNQNVVLARPLTFMNASGEAVSALLKKYRVDLGNLLVVCDDLDLEFGRLKLKPAGSSAGHRGLQSVIDSLNCAGFARLRIGIGRPRPDAEASEYVLLPFTKREKEQIKEITEEASYCCRSWVLEGITKTMNIFNLRRKQDE